MKKALRWLRMLVLALASVLAILACALSINAWIYRHRAERLLADFQSLRMEESSWPDVQRFTSKWQRWGQSRGVCNAKSCEYRVVLNSRYLFHPFRLAVDLIEEDDILRRTFISYSMNVDDYLLEITEHGTRDFGEERPANFYDQLAEHPNYFADRPGGCENCMVDWVKYTPQISDSQFRTITHFQFSCLTQIWHRCRELSDLLPVAKLWDLYQPLDQPDSYKPLWARRDSKLCQASAEALARESTYIWRIRVRAKREASNPDFADGKPTLQLDTYDLLDVLKAPSSQLHSPKELSEFVGAGYPPRFGPAPLHKDGRYVLFMDAGDVPSIHENTPLQLGPCSALADNASTLEGVGRATSDVTPPLKHHDELGYSDLVFNW